jgi:hypothetical protein
MQRGNGQNDNDEERRGPSGHPAQGIPLKQDGVEQQTGESRQLRRSRQKHETGDDPRREDQVTVDSRGEGFRDSHGA